jgi:hypothetical protein
MSLYSTGYYFAVCWIRILIAWVPIYFGRLDPDPGGQKSPTKIEISEELHVLKYWMFSFWRLRPLLESDVLFVHGGLWIINFIF